MNPSELPYGERRLNPRKPCSRMIQIDDHYNTYNGQITDLTTGGAFIASTGENPCNTGQELILTIPFRLKEGHLTVKAKVAWAKPHGMGVRFIAPQTID